MNKRPTTASEDDAGHSRPDTAPPDGGLTVLPPEILAHDLLVALFEQSPFSIVIYDMDGRPLAVNRAFTDLMGLDREDVPDDYTILTDPQLDETTVMPLVRRAFAGEALLLPPVRYDGAVYGRSGRSTWTQAQLYPVRDEAGAVVRVVLVHIDLTARVEAEAALDDSRIELHTARQRLAAILDAVGNGITVQDPGGRIVYANDAAARLCGFDSADAFLAAPVDELLRRFELLDENGDPMALADLPGRRAARGEPEPHRLLRYRVHATGEDRWSYVRARAIPAVGDEPPLVVNVFDDVTAERLHQKELEETTSRLGELAREQEATLEELRVRSAESEAARAEAEWSEAQWRYLAEAGRILGSSLDVETTLASVARLAVPRIADWCTVHVIDADGSVRQIEVAHADPQRLQDAVELERRYPPDPAISAIYRVMRAGTAELYPDIPDDLLVAATRDEEHLRMLRALGLLSAMIVPLRTPDRIVGAITFIAAESRRHYDERDLAFAESLAERAANAIHSAELYQEAQHANRAKSEFLAVMSHELRTPLNAILGYTDLLTGGISGTLNDRQQEQMVRIDASARHLTQLIDTVLAFARIEAGRDEVSISDVDAADTAREAITYVSPAADKKGLTIDVTRIRSMRLRTDVAKLRQILLNLLSNAVKFTEQGTIDVAVGHNDSHVVITVTDSGVGIEPEDLPRIWEPFAQLGPAFTRRTGGTGLGLPVSASLAQLLGGSIDVTSEVGKGSTFVLRLPYDYPA